MGAVLLLALLWWWLSSDRPPPPASESPCPPGSAPCILDGPPTCCWEGTASEVDPSWRVDSGARVLARIGGRA